MQEKSEIWDDITHFFALFLPKSIIFTLDLGQNNALFPFENTNNIGLVAQ